MTEIDFRVSTSMDRSLRLWSKNIRQEDERTTAYINKFRALIENLTDKTPTDISVVVEEARDLLSNISDALYELDNQVAEVDGCEIPFESSGKVVEYIRQMLDSLHQLEALSEHYFRLKSKSINFNVPLDEELKDKEGEFLRVLSDFHNNHIVLSSYITELLAEFDKFVAQSEELRQKRIL